VNREYIGEESVKRQGGPPADRSLPDHKPEPIKRRPLLKIKPSEWGLTGIHAGDYRDINR
jgi:hypothetical protein